MKRIALAAASIAIAASGAFTTVADSKVRVDHRSEQLQKAVKVKNIREHQKALQRIADRNNGTRASGTSGFERSVAYVRHELREAGYRVQTLAFVFPFYQQNVPSVLEQTQPVIRAFAEADTDGNGDFETMQYSGSGNVTAVAQGVDGGLVLPPVGGSKNGCNPADFGGFTPGNIAVIQRGFCTFSDKVDNAAAAGASAVIIFNEGNPGRTGLIGGGTLGGTKLIPVISVAHALGVELRTGLPTLKIVTDITAEDRTTYNLLAETSGDPDNVVVVGAHLDSVLEGPGIEDNGSGSSAILEIAKQMEKEKFRTRNKVRFMWFGAEESGLLGSEDYVASLSDADKAKIGLNLNFDMIASPNFVRFAYDGDGSISPGDPAAAGPPGSAEIEQVFAEHFSDEGLPFEPTAFDGRSDYGPFIDAGIPAGGLFTGAEDLKTAEQQAIYGGTAGVKLDPCYHKACDTYDNNNEVVFEEMADAAADAIWTFANRPRPTGVTAIARSAVSATDSKRNWDYKGSHLQR